MEVRGVRGESEIAQERANVDDLLLVAFLEQRDERVGEEHQPEDIDLELSITISISKGLPRMGEEVKGEPGLPTP